jgi:hypothetical protein
MKHMDESSVNSKNQHIQNAKNVSLAENITQRARKNESFFSSFIDLIPARIYMNPDDRHNWMEIVSNQSKKKKPLKSSNDASSLTTTEKTEAATSGKSKKESSSEFDDEIVEESENGIIKPNRFDPRFFKTVSQILKDLEAYHQNNKRNIELKTNLKRVAKFNSLSEQPKNTSVKVFNKSQNKSSKNNAASSSNDQNKNDAQEEAETTLPGNVESETNGTSKKTAVKRPSKFKEQKREVIKRQRQRYDSQSEPQIVQIDHSDANSTENRKPVFNKNGQMVFSKFDFTADKTISSKKHKDNKLTVTNAKPKDYKKLLKKLQEEREKKELLKQTEPEKASELELKSKWKSAIDKAAGVKIKDDVDLLKKSVKRIEKKKEKSKKNWEERTKSVEQQKKKLQDKRKKNMDKRKEKNKETKMKKLKKKGRILPGF